MKKVLLMMVATIGATTNVVARVSDVDVYPNSDNTLLWVVIGLVAAGLLYLLYSKITPAKPPVSTNTPTPLPIPPTPTAVATNLPEGSTVAQANPYGIAVAVSGSVGGGATPTVQINMGGNGGNCGGAIPSVTATQKVTVTPEPITFEVQTQTNVLGIKPTTT